MPPKILVVDDEADILKSVSFRLQKAGYEVVTAADGQAALEAFEANRPDLILLDVKLPRVDGYDVCRQIREREQGLAHHVPIIFSTADSSVKIVENTNLVGAQDYLLKPFDALELAMKLGKYLP